MAVSPSAAASISWPAFVRRAIIIFRRLSSSLRMRIFIIGSLKREGVAGRSAPSSFARQGVTGHVTLADFSPLVTGCCRYSPMGTPVVARDRAISLHNSGLLLQASARQGD